MRLGLCVQCGCVFEDTSSRKPRLYCSQLCRGRKYAGTELRTIECQWCSTRFETMTPGSPRYCSDRCKKDSLNARERAKRDVQRLVDGSYALRCEECGDGFTHQMAHTKYCDECRHPKGGSKQAVKEAAKRRRATYQRPDTPAYREAKAANRAMRRGARVGEVFDPVEIFRRDRWHCQECGIYTPAEYRGTNEEYAPELDHIVPISAGGKHTKANTQLLCKACNASKGATLPHLWHQSPYGLAQERVGEGV